LHFTHNNVYNTLNTIQILTITHTGLQYTTAQCQLLTGFTNEFRHLFNKHVG